MIETEFVAALNAEKAAQNPQPEAAKKDRRPPAAGETSKPDVKKQQLDVESGTAENWNEGLAPPKPIRRKFSRTVPYETAIDGGGSSTEAEAAEEHEEVSGIVLVWCGRERGCG